MPITDVELLNESLTNRLFANENAIKDYYLLLQPAIETQRVIIEQLRVLAQRYIILTKDTPNERKYPPEASHQVEDEIRKSFHSKLSSLHDSNSKLTLSLSNARNSYFAFGDLLAEAGANQLSAVDQMDSIQPPLTYFIELFGDFLKFFTRTQSNLNCNALLLMPSSIPSLERYKKLLEPNKEFNDHFLKALAYCSCLHANKKEKT